jgi:plasmid stabilization system protein ParE
MRVVWTQAALDTIEQAYNCIADINPAAAERVAECLYSTGDSLAHFPRRGRCVAGTAMRELITDFSYILRYQITGDTVEIVRVRHTSRRPTTP